VKGIKYKIKGGIYIITFRSLFGIAYKGEMKFSSCGTKMVFLFGVDGEGVNYISGPPNFS